MQRVMIAAIAVVVGVVLGGTLPRAEARRLEARMEELELRKCGPGVGSDLGRMLRGVGSSEPNRPGIVREKNPDLADTDEVDDDEAPPSRGPDAMKTAMRLRSTQSRAALVEDANPNDEQLDTLDAAVDQMNAELLELADQLASRLEEGEVPSRHDQLAFAADALDILLEADASLRGTLDPEQLDAVEDGSIDPFSYVDPAIIERLDRIERR